MDQNTRYVEEYSARECIEYAISCLKNKDNRKCTIRWLERALAQLPEDDVDEVKVAWNTYLDRKG